MKNSLIVFLFFTGVVFSCKKDGTNSCYTFDTDHCTNTTNSNYANVRIQNISNYDFCSVKVMSPGINKTYDGIKQGSSTCYMYGNPLYQFAEVSLYIQGEYFSFVPVNYPNNTELDKGFYTYQLDILDYTTKLVSIKIIKDY